MSEYDIEVQNICPGTPERPVTGSELTFRNLRGKWYEQAKLDGDRVILAHGMAFNRHGQLYQRDYEQRLGDIYHELRNLFDEKVFDIEYLPTGANAGRCALLDIPNMHHPYEMRHLIIKSSLPCQPAHESYFKYDICALPSYECNGIVGELYRDMKYLAEDDDLYPFEGVVLKKSSHIYKWDNKDTSDWVKVRFK